MAEDVELAKDAKETGMGKEAEDTGVAERAGFVFMYG